MTKSKRSLSAEDKALSSYIAAMFGDAVPESEPEPMPIRPAPVPTRVEAEPEANKLANVAKLLAETAIVELPPVIEPPPAVVVATPVPVVGEAPVPSALPQTPEPTITAVAENDAEPELIVPPERSVELIPEWGEKRFQTLFFRVGPLTLAVPLSQLGGIHAIGDKLTPLFGRPKWFMGLQPYQEGNMQVVDTARWVMPEKYADVSAEGLDYQYVILLANSPWALACSQVHDAVTLEHDDIRWRTSIGKRPWLAGVVVEKMCALLDVENFIYLLEQNNFERKAPR